MHLVITAGLAGCWQGLQKDKNQVKPEEELSETKENKNFLLLSLKEHDEKIVDSSTAFLQHKYRSVAGPGGRYFPS